MEFQKSITEKQLQEVFNQTKGKTFAHLRKIFPSATDEKSMISASVLLSQLVLQEAVCCIGDIDPEKDQAVMTDNLSVLAKFAAEYIEEAGGDYLQRFRARCKKIKHYESIASLRIWEFKYILIIGTGLPEEDVKLQAWGLVDWLEEKAKEYVEYIQKMQPQVVSTSTNLSLNLEIPGELEESVKTEPEKSLKKTKK